MSEDYLISLNESRALPQRDDRYPQTADGPPSPIGGRSTQWATADDTNFQPVGRSVTNLTPGAYTINQHHDQIYFRKFELKTTGLLKLPGTILGEVVAEIDKFWDLYDYYKSFGINHRRGILIGGPAGSGKSCTLKLVAADVIKRGGVIIPYQDANLLIAGMKCFREIQPTTPVVILMEDLDAILEQSRHGQSIILNLLDGVISDALDRVVFMATTNFFDELERRITNRPSRFDRVFVIENPNDEARMLYLEHLFTDNSIPDGFDLKKVAADTNGLSFAHLKEIVTSVAIMGNKYDKVLEAVKAMAEETLPSGDDMEMPQTRRNGIGLLAAPRSRRTRSYQV